MDGKQWEYKIMFISSAEAKEYLIIIKEKERKEKEV